MDILILSLAVKKALAELGVKVESTIAPGVLTYDGNEEGKEVVALGVYHFVKLLDRPVAETEIESVTISKDGYTYTGKKADFQVAWVSDDLFGITLFSDTGVEFGNIFSVSKESDLGGGIVFGEGTYVGCAPGAAAEIHGVLMPTETIHTIDPKYLATEIKLEDYGINLQEILFGSSTLVTLETAGLWQKINECENIVFLCDAKLRSDSGETIKIIPCNYFRDNKNGYICAITFEIALWAGAMMKASVHILNELVNGDPANTSSIIAFLIQQGT